MPQANISNVWISWSFKKKLQKCALTIQQKYSWIKLFQLHSIKNEPMLGRSTEKTLQDDLPAFSIGWFIHLKKPAETCGQRLLKWKLYDPQALASYHFWNISITTADIHHLSLCYWKKKNRHEIYNYRDPTKQFYFLFFFLIFMNRCYITK